LLLLQSLFQRLNGLLLSLNRCLLGADDLSPLLHAFREGVGLQEGDLGGGTHVSVRPDFSPLGNPGDLALPANIEKLRFVGLMKWEFQP